MSLAWDAVTGATGYVLQYKRASDSIWITAPAPTGTSAVITGLAANTAYNFLVQATNAGGSSAWAAVNATTLVQPPAMPTNFRSTARTTDSVTLAWNAVTGATGYVLQYKKNSEYDWITAELVEGALSATISGLTANTEYNFRVQAFNEGGASSWPRINVTTLPLSGITMPSDGVSHDWAVRLNQTGNHTLEIVDLSNNGVVFTQSLAALDHLVINTSGTANDSLTIDFSHGDFVLANGIQFNGHAETFDTLCFTGTDGNDDVFLNGSENRFNDLAVFTQHIDCFSLNAEAGDDDTAFVPGSETGNMLNVSDNLLVVQGGGFQFVLRNFNTIDAVANGRNDKAYVFGENNSFIVMNELYVERRAGDQAYRVWHSEHVTAINLDNTNNAILHTGSRGRDFYKLAQG